MKGIGELHPDSQGFDITSRDELAPLMDLARPLGLPVLIHTSEPVGHQYPGKGETTPDRVYRLIRNFPQKHHHLRPLGRRPAVLWVDA